MAAVSYDDFLNQYYGQLSSIGLPEDLWECLYDKLFPEIVYDAGNAFVFHENEQSSKGTASCSLSFIFCFSSHCEVSCVPELRCMPSNLYWRADRTRENLLIGNFFKVKFVLFLTIL